MSLTSEYLTDDYSRLSWQAQADRIVMMKLMFEERKQVPELAMPSLEYYTGTYPGDSARDTFEECIQILCNYWKVAEPVEIDDDYLKKYENNDFLFMLLDFHFFNDLKGDTEEHAKRRVIIRDTICSAFNAAGEFDTIGAEWSKDDKNLLMVARECDMDYSGVLAHIIPLFRSLKKYAEEWK